MPTEPLASIVKRLEALGWTMPKELSVNTDSGMGFYSDEYRRVVIAAQHTRDLLCADFERWLIGKGHGLSITVLSNAAWWISTGHKQATDPDKLTALVAAAEQALKGRP